MKALGWVVALIFLACLGLGFGVLAERAFVDFSGEAAVAAIAFIGTTWFAIWSFNKTKQKEADAQLFSQKAEILPRADRHHPRHIFCAKGMGSAS